MPENLLFDHTNLLKLKEAREQGRSTIQVSTDLGLRQVELDLTALNLDIRQVKKALKKERAIFLFEDGRLRQLSVYEDGYYQLVVTGEAPTLEIDGIQMHRTSLVKPFEDSRQKAESSVRSGDIVLDTCGGLGYTSIWALRLGAVKVDSCEPNPSVRLLRSLNPWSAEFLDDRIVSHQMTSQEFLQTADDDYYDSVLHDPPRFSLAGELYSGEYYNRLAEVIRPGGRLFHYTGDPYSKGRPRKFVEGVIRRLSEAGFQCSRREDILGVEAVKSD
jgi:hypothetical protein